MKIFNKNKKDEKPLTSLEALMLIEPLMKEYNKVMMSPNDMTDYKRAQQLLKEITDIKLRAI